MGTPLFFGCLSSSCFARHSLPPSSSSPRSSSRSVSAARPLFIQGLLALNRLLLCVLLPCRPSLPLQQPLRPRVKLHSDFVVSQRTHHPFYAYLSGPPVH